MKQLDVYTRFLQINKKKKKRTRFSMSQTV